MRLLQGLFNCSDRFQVALGDYRAARDDTYRQIRRLVDQAYAAEEQLRLCSDRVLPRAKQALQLATADFRGRLVDFGEVTDGFTEVLTVELQVARAEATLAGTIAQLKRAVGCEVMAGTVQGVERHETRIRECHRFQPTHEVGTQIA
ncbi:MAG: hypothetical protein CMJ58_19775 [Planctomycetaceae bacterium]|nr:hypothetical protein [Planctomycetaceae bacterium]